MELSAETKNNLELLDKILKYVKPSYLSELTNDFEIDIDSVSEGFASLDFHLKDAINHWRYHNREDARDNLFLLISLCFKTIEMIDNGES